MWTCDVEEQEPLETDRYEVWTSPPEDQISSSHEFICPNETSEVVRSRRQRRRLLSFSPRVFLRVLILSEPPAAGPACGPAETCRAAEGKESDGTVSENQAAAVKQQPNNEPLSSHDPLHTHTHTHTHAHTHTHMHTHTHTHTNTHTHSKPRCWLCL